MNDPDVPDDLDAETLPEGLKVGQTNREIKKNFSGNPTGKNQVTPFTSPEAWGATDGKEKRNNSPDETEVTYVRDFNTDDTDDTDDEKTEGGRRKSKSRRNVRKSRRVVRKSRRSVRKSKRSVRKSRRVVRKSRRVVRKSRKSVRKNRRSRRNARK